MKKVSSSVVWGIVIVVVGILLLIKNLDLIDINIFFEGWWTLFIIIPSLFGLLKKGSFVSSSLGLIIGILLLLATREIIEWNVVGKVFIPSIIIIVGLSFIFKSNVKKIKESNNASDEYIGIFSGTSEKIKGEFNGSNCLAVFGGVELDLRNATITNDIVIECVSVFAGITIFVPDNAIVKLSGVPIFGGAENKATQNVSKKAPTIYINYVCVFGGVEIK